MFFFKKSILILRLWAKEGVSASEGHKKDVKQFFFKIKEKFSCPISISIYKF